MDRNCVLLVLFFSLALQHCEAVPVPNNISATEPKVYEVDQPRNVQQIAKADQPPKVDQVPMVDQATKVDLFGKVPQIAKIDQAIIAGQPQKSDQVPEVEDQPRKTDQAQKVDQAPKVDQATNFDLTGKVSQIAKIDQTIKAGQPQKSNQEPKVDEPLKLAQAQTVNQAPGAQQSSIIDQAQKVDHVMKVHIPEKVAQIAKIDQVIKAGQPQKSDQVPEVDQPRKPDQAQKVDQVPELDRAIKAGQPQETKPEEVRPQKRDQGPALVPVAESTSIIDQAPKIAEVMKAIEAANIEETSKADHSSKVTNLSQPEGSINHQTLTLKPESSVAVPPSEQTNPKEWSLHEIQQILNATRNKLKELEEVVDNIVPVGFVYVQYPWTDEPSKIWRRLKWQEISSQYGGAFFRALGGGEPWEKKQVQDSFRLAQVEYTNQDVKNSPITNSARRISFSPGTWSDPINTGWSGKDTTKDNSYEDSIRFLVQDAEVRPYNYGIRFWRRVDVKTTQP